jgi:hypothetical protein
VQNIKLLEMIYEELKTLTLMDIKIIRCNCKIVIEANKIIDTGM